MKVGVAMLPCGVTNVPVRALPNVLCVVNSKDIDLGSGRCGVHDSAYERWSRITSELPEAAGCLTDGFHRTRSVDSVRIRDGPRAWSRAWARYRITIASP